jgi:hypothetical protein
MKEFLKTVCVSKLRELFVEQTAGFAEKFG